MENLKKEGLTNEEIVNFAENFVKFLEKNETGEKTELFLKQSEFSSERSSYAESKRYFMEEIISANKFKTLEEEQMMEELYTRYHSSYFADFILILKLKLK